MDEQERLAACREIAERMYVAGTGDCYNEIERFTRLELLSARAILFGNEQMPEPSPYERGVLDRYQNGYKKPSRKHR